MPYIWHDRDNREDGKNFESNQYQASGVKKYTLCMAPSTVPISVVCPTVNPNC